MSAKETPPQHSEEDERAVELTCGELRIIGRLLYGQHGDSYTFQGAEGCCLPTPTRSSNSELPAAFSKRTPFRVALSEGPFTKES